MLERSRCTYEGCHEGCAGGSPTSKGTGLLRRVWERVVPIQIDVRFDAELVDCPNPRCRPLYPVDRGYVSSCRATFCPLLQNFSRPQEEYSAKHPETSNQLHSICFRCLAPLLFVQELSMTGAAMGILTVVGHATDSLVNAVGLASLLYARRKVRR